MVLRLLLLLIPFFLLLPACDTTSSEDPITKIAEVEVPDRDFWNNASIYFLLTDRFNNADPNNDLMLGRQADGATLRYFLGGDLKGVTQKISEGYFSDLGINALWMTPFFEQIQGSVDEGTGLSYGYHGYWIRDWTAVDPNLGTMEDLRKLVATAHENGIRIIMDVVINHTGPVTELDNQWPDSWVITGPRCVYEGYESFVSCTLVDNLPDIRTNRDEPVELPDFLLAKWEAEGRLEKELEELDAFFERTGYPRAPRYYIIKWITDWIRELGIDGYRMDTAKHFEKEVSIEVRKEAEWAFEDWKARHPDRKLPDLDFFTFAEVYGYGVEGGLYYDYGDRKTDFFAYGYNSLINFGFKEDALLPFEDQFRKYADSLGAGGVLQAKGVVNYLNSHDDADSYDRDRKKPLESGTRLLLSPGAAQVYYGDESARSLRVEEAEGDAQLRSFMNWEDLLPQAMDSSAIQTLEHWQKLGQFRRRHIAIGAGVHQLRQEKPYLFSREYRGKKVTDKVLIGLNLPVGEKRILVYDLFQEGAYVRDAYSGSTVAVQEGRAIFNTPYSILLLEGE